MTAYLTDHRTVSLRPWAQRAISAADYDRLRLRAESLGVRLGGLAARPGEWIVTCRRAPGQPVSLRGKGSLAALLDAVIDDWQETQA